MRRILLAVMIALSILLPASSHRTSPAVVRADSCVSCRPPDYVPNLPGPALHGLGATLPAGALAHAAGAAHVAYRRPAGLPASVDLSRYDPPVGDQGQVGSCVAWATGYNLRGWYANRDGYYPTAAPGGYSAMSVYYHLSQDYDHGTDGGATIQHGMAEQELHGINTRAEYQPQGDFDFTTPPTGAQVGEAAQRWLPGYDDIFDSSSLNHGLEGVPAIEAALAEGKPVVLAIAVDYGFELTGPTDPLIDTFDPRFIMGGHAVMADAYDKNGIWIENQWTAQWGFKGRAELGWDFLAAALYGAVVAEIPAPAPTATATPTYVPPTATATPVPPSPTASATPAQPDLVPWSPKAPALPAALPAGTYSVLMIVRDSYGRTRAMAVVKAVKR